MERLRALQSSHHLQSAVSLPISYLGSLQSPDYTPRPILKYPSLGIIAQFADTPTRTRFVN